MIVMDGTYSGGHLPPLHLEFALLDNKTQVCEVQVIFRCCSFTKSFQGDVVGVAHVIGVVYPLFSLISA